MAWNSSRSSGATVALRPGGFTTRPSASSTRSASRTGMKLTSSCSASFRNDRLCPGGRVPARIERRISLVTCSDTDRDSMGRTDPELADAIVMSAPIGSRGSSPVGSRGSRLFRRRYQKYQLLDCYHISGLRCDPRHAGGGGPASQALAGDVRLAYEEMARGRAPAAVG